MYKGYRNSQGLTRAPRTLATCLLLWIAYNSCKNIIFAITLRICGEREVGGGVEGEMSEYLAYPLNLYPLVVVIV